MRVTIYQPRFFPQLHYFNRICDSDVFVILDDAQYTKSLIHEEGTVRKRYKSFQSDTPIASVLGVQMITVPILHGEHQPINSKRIDYSQKWIEQALKRLQLSYINAPFFDAYFPQVQRLLKERYANLAELNTKTILWGLAMLLKLSLPYEKITLDEVNASLQASSYRLKRIIMSSHLGVKRPEGAKKGTEWTIAICKALSATEYLHGGTASNAYMDLRDYKREGIATIEQQWVCQEYPQRLQSEFLPNLSLLDLLFSVNIETARHIVLPQTPEVLEKKESAYAWV